MLDENKLVKIKILKNGPFLVTGNVPLAERIIVPKGKSYEYKNGHEFPQAEEYSLCRCGQTKNAPFCDGAHENVGFIGEEKASRETFEDRADMFEGPALDLLDDNRCALARFCHREDGNVWELTENSDNPNYRAEAIIAASECPAGRLVAYDKSGKPIEPKYEPTIDILQDSEKKVSGPIFVKGNIPIEASDGFTYEIRNRVTLCRCGKSRNSPFCDATHIAIKFSDKSSYQKGHNELLENYHKSIDSFIEHRKKEAKEDLRRHDELVEASKNSRASVTIGSIEDNATGFSSGSKDSPEIVINQVFNYEKASVILEAIKGKFNDPLFNSEFGDDAEQIKQLVNKALKQVQDKDDPTLIQKSLAVVSDSAIRVSSGVIASGIIVLLGRLSKK